MHATDTATTPNGHQMAVVACNQSICCEALQIIGGGCVLDLPACRSTQTKAKFTLDTMQQR